MDFTNHPFLNVIWTFFIIFVWISWFWLLISISVDIFRRHDIGGFAKAIWFIVIIFLPLIGSLIYLISQGVRWRNAAPKRRAGSRKASTPTSRAGGRVGRRDREGQGPARLRRDQRRGVPEAQGKALA